MLSLGPGPEYSRRAAHRFAPRQIALAQDSDNFVNVRAFGAKGNGIADDTAAIQAAIDAAKPGEVIYFTPGIYTVSNFVVKNRAGLSFRGEGRESVIRQKSGAGRIATFESSRDIVISNLTFDANGIQAFGGVTFYAVARVRIENNRFFDSAPKPWGKPDRDSFNFARGSEPSRDIEITDNAIEDLQLDFAHSQRVVVARNVIRRGGKTAGIGIYSVGDNSIAEDFQIADNRVIDPIGAGFNVGIDSATDAHCIFRKITLAGNQVIRTKTAGYGIRIGTPDNSKRTTGNIFEDIAIVNNRLTVESGAPQPLPLIFANSSVHAEIRFERLVVAGNTIENDGPINREFAIDLRRIRNSIVADNSVRGVANGIAIGGDLFANEIRGNVVAASDIAYALADSVGKNQAAHNRFLGNPKQAWKLSDLHSSDSIKR